MNGTLYGVSVGPGDPELLTLKAARIIRQCPVIAVPRSADENAPIALGIALQAVPEISSKQIVELSMPMTRDKAELDRTRGKAADRLMELLAAGSDVAFLTLGDVSVYSTYFYLDERVRACGYETRVIAGVPSFCAAAARLGVSLTEASQPLHIIPGSYSGVDEGLGYAGAKVLMKTGKSIEQMKARLKERGLYESARMVQKCGMEGERVFDSLDGADADASYFSIIVVKG